MQINMKVKKSFFNEAYLPYLRNKERITVFYGGAGSGKSVFAVQKMIIKLAENPNRTCLVVRKVQDKIRDSIYAEYKAQLQRFGLLEYCDVQETMMKIELPNGSRFMFKGIDDPEKIKSIHGIDDIMIEEASDITKDDFTQLNLRLRSRKPNQQIVLMFNPVSKMNWVYKTFFAQEPPVGTVIIKTTWKDNKFLPQSYLDYLEDLKRTNPTYYQIYALGEFASLGKLVYNNWKVQVRRVNSLVKHGYKYYFGLDFGYTNDPTAFVVVLVNQQEKKMYIHQEHYERGMLNSDICDMIISKGFKNERITADSSEPKSIRELKKSGIQKIRGARKGKDSVLNGIQYIQQYQIEVSPACKNMIVELENYTWEKDKQTGEYINKPIDGFNHLLDALRYAIEELTRGSRMKNINKGTLGL